MDKVVLTQEQADEIEIQKKEFRTSDVVVRRILTENMYTNRHEVFHSMTIDDVIRALYIGYEVEPEFKVGDWVKSTFGNGIGKITQIHAIGQSRWYETDSGMFAEPDDIRHATEEEIAEEKERRTIVKLGTIGRGHVNEQLEEIINDLPYSIRHEGNVEALIDYAKEQAERVEIVSDTLNQEVEHSAKLEQQNKRYRELVNQIISIMSHPYSKTWNKDKTLYKLDIILRAYVQELESESNE